MSASRTARTAPVGTSESDGVFTVQATKEMTMGGGDGAVRIGDAVPGCASFYGFDVVV